MCSLAIRRFFYEFTWVFQLVLSWEVCLFCYWVIEDLCIFWICDLQMFPPILQLPPSCFSAFLGGKYFNFDIINLSILLIHSLWFCIIARQSVPNLKPWVFTPTIPSKPLLMFRPLIHLALTFCIWCKVRVQLHSFPDGTPVSRHRIYSFLCLGTGVEIQLTV